eukprot:TRINITY_DN31561_c0_g1_i2.p7 TRINITY_DN31561_c0_g1~~TRINITY_DN31561_c0_g1_i2.p7  ORF type:complete len:108 (-),score=12.41 TRINITY_DN31561_c0_g1_i2:629-952(-)
MYYARPSLRQLILLLSAATCAFVVMFAFFFLMIRRPPRSTHCISSAASDVYKRQLQKVSTVTLIIAVNISGWKQGGRSVKPQQEIYRELIDNPVLCRIYAGTLMIGL